MRESENNKIHINRPEYPESFFDPHSGIAKSEDGELEAKKAVVKWKLS